MAYVTPTSKTTGDLIAATDWNQNTVDNPIAIRTGGIAISSQAANDVIYASSSTQLARLPAGTAGQVLATQGAGSAPSWIDQSQGLRQSFRGLTLRTHPDADVAASKVFLDHADEIVMHDGTRVADWDDLTADITASGAGGLDTGSEGASRWYEIHAIRKSSDGTKNLLLHRAKDWALDQSQTTDDGGASSPGLRYDANQERLGQSFVAGLTGYLPFVDVKLDKFGTPTGRLWLTLEADSAGAPSGTALATSDKIDVSLIATTDQLIRMVFRTPVSLTATTTYWLVMRGDYTVSAANGVAWLIKGSGNPYASGTAAFYNGSAWSNQANKDFHFKTYITQNDTAVTMPSGYDQRAQVGWVYNDSGSNFISMFARDRDVAGPQTLIISGGAATVYTLTDLSAVIPPIPVVVDKWQYFTNTSGASSFVAPTIAGLATCGWVFDSTLNYSIAIGVGVPFEYQHLYYGVSAGQSTFRVRGYRW